MKKLLAVSLLSSSLLFNIGKVKADWDYWGVKQTGSATSDRLFGQIDLYTINSATGASNFITTKCIYKYQHINDFKCDASPQGIDASTGEIIIRSSIENLDYLYDLSKDTWRTRNVEGEESWKSNFDFEYIMPSITKDSDGNSVLKMDNEAVVSKKSNGEIHFGKNSLITTLEDKNGVQPLYAKDASGKRIPINIEGSRLLINGRDVEQSINNVGALSAALTGLPTVPTDTTLACGLGTGTHGGDFAFSGGCASKVNDKLSINYAASMTIPGQDYAGDFEDTFSARAGFVWKLGKSVKPNLISMKAKEKMEAKIFSLEEKNEKIISQNEDLKYQNQSIISQNKALSARLERLEKVALGESKSKDLATIKLP